MHSWQKTLPTLVHGFTSSRPVFRPPQVLRTRNRGAPSPTGSPALSAGGGIQVKQRLPASEFASTTVSVDCGEKFERGPFRIGVRTASRVLHCVVRGHCNLLI